MRHGAGRRRLEPPRGFDARQRLDYLAIVIKRGRGEHVVDGREPIWPYPPLAGALAVGCGRVRRALRRRLAARRRPRSGHDLQMDRRQRPGDLFGPAAHGQLQGGRDQRTSAAGQPECGEGPREQGRGDKEAEVAAGRRGGQGDESARRGQPEPRAMRKGSRPDHHTGAIQPDASSTRPTRKASARQWTMRLSCGSVSGWKPGSGTTARAEIDGPSSRGAQPFGRRALRAITSSRGSSD